MPMRSVSVNLVRVRVRVRVRARVMVRVRAGRPAAGRPLLDCRPRAVWNG